MSHFFTFMPGLLPRPSLSARTRPDFLRLAGACLLALAISLTALLTGCGGEKPAPVVVIGLDGADFDLLAPWIEAGDLPNLEKFFAEAAIGELETVYPILSPVCWTSASTGVNPGKHGIYDFQKTDPDGGDPLVESATNRRASPVWMLLSDAGYRVGVMNVPMTYPPDPVRGRMISGFPFPNADVTITYPPELHAQLKDYPLDYLGLTLFDRTEAEMLRDFYKGMEARAEVAREWIRSGDYEFMWLVFTAPDKVQHFFWKDMDPNHPRYEAAKAAEFGTAIHDLWVRQDQILGDLLAELPADARVIMLSDHGFEAIYRQVNMANWLPHTEVPDWLQDHAIPPMLITNGILHYVLQGEMVGSSDREEFVDLFTGVCRDFRDPETGEAPFESVFRREDIYHGRMLEKAPDIVFHEHPFYYVTRGVPDVPDTPWVQDIWTTSFSAHHRPHGILAMKGPGVKPGKQGTVMARIHAGGDFRDAHIMDVSPTILALLNQPVPDQMDGRVLTEGMLAEYLQRYPVKTEEVPGFLLDRPAPLPEGVDKESMRAIPYIQ